MAKKRVRIKDIAEAAAVSTGTVDRVLHNRGNVTFEVKKRVEEVMKKLNYQPNIMAQTLANNKVFKIATLLPNYSTDIFWKAPIKGIETAIANNQHFSLEVVNYFFDEKDAQTFVNQSFEILNDAPDALILAPIFAQEAQQFLIDFSSKKIPFVLINSNLIVEKKLCYIGQDSFQSGVLAAKLISTRQSKNATFLMLHLEEKENVENTSHILQKEAGFFSYFNKIQNSFTVIKRAFSDEKKGVTLAQFLKEIITEFPNPNGIFVSTSKAYQLIELIGDELENTTIVGFDLLPPNIQFLKTGKIDYLINQNPEKQGYLAITNLIDHLLLKKEIKKVNYLPLDIVVKENLEYYF